VALAGNVSRHDTRSSNGTPPHDYSSGQHRQLARVREKRGDTPLGLEPGITVSLFPHAWPSPGLATPTAP